MRFSKISVLTCSDLSNQEKYCFFVVVVVVEKGRFSDASCSNYRSILSSCRYYREDFDYRSILVDSGSIVQCLVQFLIIETWRLLDHLQLYLLSLFLPRRYFPLSGHLLCHHHLFQTITLFMTRILMTTPPMKRLRKGWSTVKQICRSTRLHHWCIGSVHNSHHFSCR